jgi:hypothetical protein
MKTGILLALLVSDAQAWVSPMRTLSKVHPSTGKSVLAMGENEGVDKVQLTSGRKEIMFDEKSGRFFETNLEAAECIPDEEFCPIDEESGERIRLTIAEKERIFLDSLQVGSAIKQCTREEQKEIAASHFCLVLLRQWQAVAC